MRGSGCQDSDRAESTRVEQKSEEAVGMNKLVGSVSVMLMVVALCCRTGHAESCVENSIGPGWRFWHNGDSCLFPGWLFYSTKVCCQGYHGNSQPSKVDIRRGKTYFIRVMQPGQTTCVMFGPAGSSIRVTNFSPQGGEWLGCWSK